MKVREVIDKAKEYLDIGRKLELIEIVKSSSTGSPRKAGAFMFVDDEGVSFGTIGGGAVEYKAILLAKDLLEKGLDGEESFSVGGDGIKDTGMICGGDVDVKFTYLTNDERSIEIINVLREKNENKSIVYIFGAGHVGMELAKILDYLDFDIVIWDCREDFANSERFPMAKRVVCKAYDNIAEEISITNDDFIIVMTSGHASDYYVTKQLIATGALYMGVIGSNNKLSTMREKLKADGFSEEKINNLCAPIGLKIAAETPEEIAVAIAAEMILFRARMEKRQKSLEDNELISLYEKRGISI